MPTAFYVVWAPVYLVPKVHRDFFVITSFIYLHFFIDNVLSFFTILHTKNPSIW